MRNLFGGRLFRNRGGAIAAAVAAAVLAAILLIVYLHSYRSSVDSGKQPERVLVATKLIQHGTSGSADREEAPLPGDERAEGSAEDARAHRSGGLQGRRRGAGHLPRAAADARPISRPRRQRRSPTRSRASSARSRFRSTRHTAWSARSRRGTSSTSTSVSAGSTRRASQVRLLASDILVLVAPGAPASNAVLRIPTDQAPKFAFAADNARIWLVLRPQVGCLTPASR